MKAALAINTSFGQPELADRAMRWYEEEYQDNASNFLQMAEHWYVGHQSQRAWFSTAKKLINPNRNLSIRQAFIHLSGGYATEAPPSAASKHAGVRGMVVGGACHDV